MYCQRLLGGTTSLRIAVVGAPQSGKTTLLHELIMAMRQMGCSEKPAASDGCCGTFSTFACRASHFPLSPSSLSLPPTASFACRPEDHYRTVVRPPRSLHRVAVDFLDIPHAAFDDSSTMQRKGSLDRMKLFLMLRSAIERQDELFSIVTYQSPARQRVLIVEPSDKALLRLGLSHSLLPAAERSTRRHVDYMGWPEIYRELLDGNFARGKKLDITGRRLMERIDTYLTDSLLATLRMLWPVIASQDHLSLDDMEAHDVLRYFYILAYCQHATDIILCDRLFMPADAEGPTYNFEDLTATLAQFATQQRRRPPRVFLAFTSADHLMRHSTTRNHFRALVKGKDDTERRDTVYRAFCEALTASLQSPDVPQAAIDPDAAMRSTMMGTHLSDHLRTRVGATMSYGMWHLLRVVYPRASAFSPRALYRTLQCRLRRQPSPHEAFSRHPLLPPQTYFTASPIDSDFRVYDALISDPTQFVHTAADGNVRSLHMALQNGAISPFCFGSFQLMSDLFRYAGIWLPTKPSKRQAKSLF